MAADRCTILDRDGRPLAAIETLTNRSERPIVSLEVLVDTTRARHPSGNRLFTSSIAIAPYQTRTFEARVVDKWRYDFKSVFFTVGGCEVNEVVYADGSRWEMPSPL